MHVIAFVAGVWIVVSILWDAFETLVLPRPPRRQFRVTRLFYRSTWRLWVTCTDRIASPTRRQRYLAVYGPLSVFLLVTVWASMLLVGFALLQWSQRELLLNVDGTAHFLDDLYMSATTLFALGLGDVAPEGRVGRLLVVAETGSGVMLISMLFSYIPIVYQSFARRELGVTQLDAWAGSPPSATELLRRLAQSGDVSRIERVLADLGTWCAELLESHLSYPAIGYFRSLHHRQSWLAALTTVLDLTALVKVGIEGLPVWPAHVTFAIARHAAVDLAHVLGGPAPLVDDRLPPSALAQLRADLEAVGLRPNRTCTADRQLAELRTSYEPYIAALSARLKMPCPAWTPAPCFARDNWETDPAHDGGPHF